MNKNRIPIVAGNWKMYKTADEALDFLYKINSNPLLKSDIQTIIFAPSLFLHALVKRQGQSLRIGAQNCYYLKEGAFTGEISPNQVKDTGIEYCLVGHSERRLIFKETDEQVNLKIKALLDYEITPVFCVGETLQEKQANKTLKVLENQIINGLKGVEAYDLKRVVIAYEPVWAIGTGEVATSLEAEQAIAFIRKQIGKLYSQKDADDVRILYGGSVKTNNIEEILTCKNIDGVLVGGASLDSSAYAKMIEIVQEVKSKLK